MLKKFNNWLSGAFADSDLNKLFLVSALACAGLWFFIGELAPLLVGILIAYVLETFVRRLEKVKIPRALAATVSVVLLILFVVFGFYALQKFLLALRGQENVIGNLVTQISRLSETINNYLPDQFAIDQNFIADGFNSFLSTSGKDLLDNTLNVAQNLFALFLYIVLMPLLVFFLLKDKHVMLAMLKKYIPESPIFAELWDKVNEQFGSYLRGKFIEGMLLGSMSWIALSFFGMNHAFALSLLMGLSVFVPFVGAVAVTIPVLLFAYLQFGTDADFWWVVLVYIIIQTIDGQIIVPLLFSEVVKIHPIAIFAAIIFFGNLWGVWGVFFAIPLASLIKSFISVIDARRNL